MKKLLVVLITFLILVLPLFGCTSNAKSSDEDNELIVFAAASMTETLTEIGDMYNENNPDIKISFNFDSSGTLKTQIEEGAKCDLFISASASKIDELNLIIEETRVDLLENKVTLVVPERNPKSIYSFDDMVTALQSNNAFVAIGNADVPVGEYTLKIFDYFNLSVEELDTQGCFTYGSNAKEVTTQVSEAMVDCGIVYQTDAYSANLEIVDTATNDMCGQVVYCAAVLETSNNAEKAKSFLDYLKSEEASAVFEKVGFTPLI